MVMNKNFAKFAAVIIILLIVVVFFALFKAGMLKFPLAENKMNINDRAPGITGGDVYGYVYVEVLPQCTFYLDPGWTLFSLCADPDNETIDATLGPTDYRYVMRWNTTRMEWDIYSPRSVENPFENFTVNESYFTLLYTTNLVYITGPENGDMNISMVQGWDAPSWPYLFDVNVTKYFNSTIHRYMMKWSNPSQEFLIYSPRSVDNPFEKIFKVEGQMIYAYDNHTLVYNKTELQSP